MAIVTDDDLVSTNLDPIGPDDRCRWIFATATVPEIEHDVSGRIRVSISVEGSADTQVIVPKPVSKHRSHRMVSQAQPEAR